MPIGRALFLSAVALLSQAAHADDRADLEGTQSFMATCRRAMRRVLANNDRYDRSNTCRPIQLL
jgi:hypothetical protein